MTFEDEMTQERINFIEKMDSRCNTLAEKLSRGESIYSSDIPNVCILAEELNRKKIVYSSSVPTVCIYCSKMRRVFDAQIQ